MTENGGTPPQPADLVLSRAAQPAQHTPNIAKVTDDANARAAVKASTDAVIARQQQKQAAPAAAPTADVDTAAATTREDVESIEFPLLDGRAVVMAPVQGISLFYKVALICGEESGQAGMLLNNITKMLMAVRSINGVPLRALNNKVDVIQAMNEIGDNNLDLMMEAYQQHWPQPTKSDLRIVKKNLRGS